MVKDCKSSRKHNIFYSDAHQTLILFFIYLLFIRFYEFLLRSQKTLEPKTRAYFTCLGFNKAIQAVLKRKDFVAQTHAHICTISYYTMFGLISSTGHCIA